jgi:hypothetical protein
VSPAAEKIPRKTIDVSLCAYCKRSGHDIENCFTRKRNETRSKLNQRFSKETKRVKICLTPNHELSSSTLPYFYLELDGRRTDVLLDTGSQVSLVRSHRRLLYPLAYIEV